MVRSLWPCRSYKITRYFGNSTKQLSYMRLGLEPFEVRYEATGQHLQNAVVPLNAPAKITITSSAGQSACILRTSAGSQVIGNEDTACQYIARDLIGCFPIGTCIRVPPRLQRCC